MRKGSVRARKGTLMDTVTSEPSVRSREALDNTRDGVFIVDADRRVLFFNRACERLTGFRREDMVGQPCHCHDVTTCTDEYGRSLMGKLCPTLRVFSGEVRAARQRLRLRRRDGRQFWVEATYTPLTGEQGKVACVLVVVRDISDQKKKEDELRNTTSDLRGEVERLRGEMRQRYGFSTIVSRSPKMEPVFTGIRAAGQSNSPVLISGESGTGKEIVARTIHYNSLQKDGPFVPVNCSALTPDLVEAELFGHLPGAFAGAKIDYAGLFRAAEGGTIFLDEITAMPTEVQAKLSRVLQDHRVRPVGSTRETPVHVRVIATSDLSPADAVAAGTLRKNLFYHLTTISIEVPPLRERKEDIPVLVEHFIGQHNRRGLRQIEAVAPDAWTRLLGYDWPGNVRELNGAVESAIAMGTAKELCAADLPSPVRGDTIELHNGVEQPDLPLDDVLASVERQAILAALRRAGGQRSQAARAMSISRSRLYRRMEALGIHPREDVRE